jgi:hypothetical protein
MNQSIEDRMQNVEDELKQLRKEMEESVAWYKRFGWLSQEQPKYDITRETNCLWESIPVEDRMKPMGLSCPCRKCSAYC